MVGLGGRLDVGDGFRDTEDRGGAPFCWVLWILMFAPLLASPSALRFNPREVDVLTVEGVMLAVVLAVAFSPVISASKSEICGEQGSEVARLKCRVLLCRPMPSGRQEQGLLTGILISQQLQCCIGWIGERRRMDGVAVRQNRVPGA